MQHLLQDTSCPVAVNDAKHTVVSTCQLLPVVRRQTSMMVGTLSGDGFWEIYGLSSTAAKVAQTLLHGRNCGAVPAGGRSIHDIPSFDRALVRRGQRSGWGPSPHTQLGAIWRAARRARAGGLAITWPAAEATLLLDWLQTVAACPEETEPATQSHGAVSHLTTLGVAFAKSVD